ncbi:MAG: hypothetical protein WCK90_05940 [archaeon]
MRSESRKWFDCAYEQTHGWLPFGIFTGKVDRRDLEMIDGGVMSTSQLDELEKIIAVYHSKMPPVEDFREEKERIYPMFTEDLKRVLPFVETAVSFGSVQGDIDLGLICSEELSDGSLREAIVQSDMPSKYRIVDWDTTVYFKSYDGGELVRKIAQSRRDARGSEVLPDYERLYIDSTVNRSRILYGCESRLEEMKKELEKLLLTS